MLSLDDRAREIAAFLGMDEAAAIENLRSGFLPLHHAVTDDFRAANPRTDEELLNWYRTTEAYIWELTAYHLDAGFNYSGMCQGIADGLKARGVISVLCLGDGIGDLTLTLTRAGLKATYHDLAFSRTADYALFRIEKQTGEMAEYCLTDGFDPFPCRTDTFDAIVSLDFLEHLPNVPDWARFIHDALNPGGFFVAQNAFAMGSGPQGGMPMHLACNDRFEKDWDPLLTEVGFTQLGPQWYQKL